MTEYYGHLEKKWLDSFSMKENKKLFVEVCYDMNICFRRPFLKKVVNIFHGGKGLQMYF